MATLKGQNFRIMIWNAIDQEYKCIGMSTGCKVTLTNNTDDGTTKEDVGLSSKPTVTTKSWQVSCESLDVADTAAMLTAIKNQTLFTLCWDETETTDNQSRIMATFARKGQAYLSDGTFQFENRTNSQKSLQFSGSGELTTVPSSEISTDFTPGSYTKGQYVRLFLSSDNTTAATSVIAAAKTLSLHLSMQLQDSSTKDTAGDWQVQEPTGLSYDITTSALMRSGETITSTVTAKTLSDLETIYHNGMPVQWKIANVSGANNRTAGATICSGSALLTQLDLNGPNRADADYQATLVGFGDISISA